jgi:hypothetical protein
MMKTNTEYHIGQFVQVEPRLWAGINRPGGVGRVTHIDYCQHGYVETVDVKYVVGSGTDTKVDLDFIRPHVELERNSRSRRGREIYVPTPTTSQSEVKKRRKVSPSPGRGLSKTTHSVTSTKHLSTMPIRSLADDPRPVKKISTLTKVMATETTQSFKPNPYEPPIKIISFKSDLVNVSPLPLPNLVPPDNLSSISKIKLDHPKSDPPVSQLDNDLQIMRMIRPATDEMKQKFTIQRANPRTLPISQKRRIPLREVFDDDMNVRKAFVETVVGDVKSNASDKMEVEVDLG